MSKKFDGYYTYNASPLDSYYRVDKKYNFNEFKDMTIVAMEIPATSDFHCQIQPADKDGNNPIWLRSNEIDPKATVEIYDNAGVIKSNLRKLYNAEFNGVDVAFCGFSLSPKMFPAYDAAKKPMFLICDIFTNTRWLDYELMEELLTKYKIPTLPILYKGPGDEDIVKKFLGQKSRLSSTNTISSILVRTLHEGFDEKSSYTRKGITIIDNKNNISYTPPKTPAPIHITKEKEEDIDIPLLDAPLDTVDEINDFINSNFIEENPPALIAEEDKIKGTPKIEVLQKMLRTYHDEWASDGQALLEGYFEFSGNLKFAQPEQLFSMGLTLCEHFENYLKTSEHRFTYERMKKTYSEKTVHFEAQVICFNACKRWYGL